LFRFTYVLNFLGGAAGFELPRIVAFIAITQWTIVLLLVSWSTRRSPPSVQFAVSAMAILVAGLAFAAMMSYFGSELENISI